MTITRNYLALSLVLISLISCNDEGTSINGEGIFITTSSDFQIEGTLFLPEGQGPFRTVIIVPGSGSEERTDLEQFADLLNPAGYAVYTYDKRGIGGSTGSYPTETSENPHDFLTFRAQDVIGIIDLLKKHERIDNNNIGLVGSSQGTWVNALVYEMTEHDQDISFMVMASGGMTPTGIENYYDNLTDDPSLTIEAATELLADYNGTIGFDPRDIFTGMSIPVSFLLGGLDRSHPTWYELNLIEQMAKSNYSVHFYPNANHELTDAHTGKVSPQIFEDLIDWLNSNTL